MDLDRIALLGTGHSGGWVSLAAEDEPRLKALLLHFPFYSGSLQASRFPDGLLQRAWEERINATSPAGDAAGAGDVMGAQPVYIQAWPDSPENGRGEVGEEPMIVGEMGYWFISEAWEAVKAAGGSWENKVTLRSAYNLSRTECHANLEKITAPAYYYVRPFDPNVPMEQHRETFARLGSNAELNVYDGPGLDTPSAMFAADSEIMAAWLLKTI